MASKHALTFKAGVLLKSIGSRSSSQEYRNKQPIFFQRDAADAMFYIEAGNVKLTVLSKGGKRAVIAIFRQGDFFGEGCLGKPQPFADVHRDGGTGVNNRARGEEDNRSPHP